MRYKLISRDSDGDESEVRGQRKNTKKQIKEWCNDNINSCGLDWRIGFTIKFRNSKFIYIWKWIKDDKEVKII